ncbi:MAG: SDR family oxidoreductase [Hoeflea sp.]|uniref:SDR family NAD(P)-dependent oxidoreductase n=1 Tax=Hoeflea sp. TaxID=1940281 RepID=UPI00272EEA49|nr:SDR family oxidoreductase [Hoeflea sp.]MDP2119276.1 SDR family oxidoreductase [Hoeflea sp.]
MSENKKLAIVTGGGTGLGQACVQRFLADGYRVVSLGLDVEEKIDHPDHEERSFDVTDSAAIAALAREFDGVDALVNAAGIIIHEKAEFTNAGFAKVMDVNLRGTQEICFALEAALKARRGAIVNFASMWSYFGSSRNPAYSASKGAVDAFTRALAAAWSADGVRTNAVAPGWVKTRMSINAMNTPERAEPILKRIPMARWGEAREVANAVAFLVSDQASYITGVTLPIDGGFMVA